MSAPAAWFKAAIMRGIGNLAELKLPFAPRSLEDREALRDIWCETLWHGRVWKEESDTQSFEAAFRDIALQKWVHRFPQPADLLEAVRNNPSKQLALAPPPQTPEQRERAKEALRMCLAKLTEMRTTAQKPKGER